MVNTLIEQLLNGLTLGSIYALVALGYTMVYGILLMINFAHSEIFMLGAFISWLVFRFTSAFSLPIQILLACGAIILGCGLAVLLIEKLAYAPLRRAPRLSPLISAIGVSIILQNIIFLCHDDFVGFPQVISQTRFGWGAFQFSMIQLVILLSSLLLMGLLWVFIQHTRLGQAMRACSQDREAAELMGIPVNHIISMTFILGAVLGGFGGMLYGINYGSIKYNMGFAPGMKAFTAAVLGGIGNIPGAMLGGLLLGLCESLGAAFLPQAQWKDVFSFAILIIVLIIRPSGILGERTAEKI